MTPLVLTLWLFQSAEAIPLPSAQSPPAPPTASVDAAVTTVALPSAQSSSAGPTASVDAAVTTVSPEPGTEKDQAPALPMADASDPRYPLGRFEGPHCPAPGAPFKLVDLRYQLTDTFSTTHTFAARLAVKDWGYLGAEFEGERRTLTVSTNRLDLRLGGESGAYDLYGRVRAPWFILSTRALHRAPDAGGAWLFEPSLSVRVSSSVEILSSAAGDSSQPNDRFLREASLGFLWQRGVSFEASGGYQRSYLKTDEGSENTIDRGSLAVTGQVSRWEVSGEAFLKDTDGRFPRRETGGALGVRVSLAPRLVAEAAGQAGFEDGVGEQRHEYRGAITWFGRRYTAPRSGQSARRAAALAEEARRLRYDERLVFGD
jgi:hypothetical protein